LFVSWEIVTGFALLEIIFFFFFWKVSYWMLMLFQDCPNSYARFICFNFKE